MTETTPTVHRGQLRSQEYDRLREATRTHREELIVRLCGEAGLRAGEIARLRPDDLVGSDTDREMQYFLTVRETDGETRTGYLPSGVAHDLLQYIRSNSIAGDEPVIGVTERRIQMLVGDVTARAAEQTGRAVFETVTPSTLRAFFARQLLVEDGVDVRVVTAVGGWDGIDGIVGDLEEPTRDDIATAFERLDSPKTAAGRLSGLVQTLDGAVAGLVDAQSRSEIERSVCDALTAESYRAAWILAWGPGRERVTVRTHAGESPDRFEGAADTGIVRRALQTGRCFVAPDDPGPAAQQAGRGLLAAVPLGDSDTQYGALVVRAGRAAFDDPERALLTTLGRQIAFAISAVERKQVLLGGSVLEVQFTYDEATLVSLADRLESSLVLDGAVPGDRGFLCFVRVLDSAPKAALEATAELPGIEDSRLVRSDGTGGVLEIDLRSGSPLFSLVDRGGTVTELRVEDGHAQITCKLSPETNVRTLHDDLTDQFPTLELHSKRKRESTRESLDTRSVLDDYLTEKQRAVIRTAFHAGYFEWPRESTAEDLAESMGVSPPTLHNHLRKSQQKLLERILEHG